MDFSAMTWLLSGAGGFTNAFMYSWLGNQNQPC